MKDFKSLTEEVSYNGKLIAWILRGKTEVSKKIFPSKKEDFLQVGCIPLNEKEELQPHHHRENLRVVKKTQEVLFVVYGKIQVDFYDRKIKFSEKIINEGDVITLLDGGHGFVALEPSYIIEVKQGPYVSVEQDKEKFIPLGEKNDSSL